MANFLSQIIQSYSSDVDSDQLSLNNKQNHALKGNQAGDDDVKAVTKGFKKLNVKGKGKAGKNDDSDEEEVVPAKGKASKKSAFELLMDDDEQDEPAAQESQSEEEEKVVVSKPQKNEKKGKKAKRKGKDDDDEDLDKVLAELQAEYAGEAAPAATTVVSPEELADEFSKKKEQEAGQAGCSGRKRRRG